MDDSSKDDVGDAFVAAVATRRKPGWWVLLVLVSLLALAAIGVAAWQIKLYQQRKFERSPAQQAKVYEAVSDKVHQYDDLWQYDKEINSLEDYLAAHPDSTYRDEATMKLAKAYLNNKQYNDAIKRYRLVENNPKFQLDAWRGLAAAYLSKDNAVQARIYRQKVVDVMRTKKDPESIFKLTADEAQLNALDRP